MFAYNNRLIDYVASFPGGVYTPREVRNENPDGELLSESGAVPATADFEGKRRLNLDQVPQEQVGMTVTVAGSARTLVPYGEAPAVGQVAVSMTTGVMEFHSSDAGLAVAVTYRGKGTPIMAYLFHQLGKELAAAQTKILELSGVLAGAVLGPVSGTNNALVRFDGVTGKLVKECPGATYHDDRSFNITQGSNASRLSSASLQLNQIWNQVAPDVSGYAFTLTRVGESKDIFQILGGAGVQAGKLRWGPGGEEEIDTELYRNEFIPGVHALETNGILKMKRLRSGGVATQRVRVDGSVDSSYNADATTDRTIIVDNADGVVVTLGRAASLDGQEYVVKCGVGSSASGVEVEDDSGASLGNLLIDKWALYVYDATANKFEAFFA